jgi:putative FmdB family regulatory protein
MDEHFRCEDCGHEFPKTRLQPDLEEEPVICPNCGGVDIQLVAGKYQAA